MHSTDEVYLHDLKLCQSTSYNGSGLFVNMYFVCLQLLLFGQFVVNMAWLDTRQKDRRAAKLELLYHGADAEESSEEREVVKLVEAVGWTPADPIGMDV